MNKYYKLAKPGIIFGNLTTVAAGFLMASHNGIDIKLLCSTVLGLALVIAGACAFNNYANRKTDTKMERTKGRALVTGDITEIKALVFATTLWLVGSFILYTYTNLLTLGIANLAFFIYVLPYSLLKCKTIYNTAIGSIAGAAPPVAGYCAVTNQFDLGASILFLMMVFWQMPHFFSIAILHFDDYKNAQIQTLPISRGLFRTKIHMVIYILAFILTTFLLTFYDYTGKLFFVGTLAFNLAWLLHCIKGFRITNEQLWGQKMFQLSLLCITFLCFLVPFDIILRKVY